MPQSIYILSTAGEITLIDKEGQVWKLGEIIDFTIGDDIEMLEHRSHGGIDHQVMTAQTFHINIRFGKLDITQPLKITKKTVRRNIR